MKSICIKTNNDAHINYLLKNFDRIKINNVFFSSLQFKIYHNIIIHYKDYDNNKFISSISSILSSSIIDICEEKIIKKIISYEYFYFNPIEKSKVLDFIYDLQESDYRDKKYKILYDSFYSYISNNKNIYLDGFIPFRAKEYIDFLTKNVDNAVNNYLIDREYTEFISILKLYVNSQKSQTNLVHLFYNDSKAILLDENSNVIEDKKMVLNAKYLSDISFSENDYAFNTILSIIPQKIYIHLVDENYDEFINTLKLIFENRVVFCK